ncbi:MAG: hypothetical protein IZT59_12100 [Verrucomicrobia bacterium]|jgi:hypothetical protein|nr:hypothetical protein [Verrucomicrobiota bacterium]
MNTIWPQQSGEPPSYWRSLDVKSSDLRRNDAFADGGDVGVVGGSMSGKGVGVNAGACGVDGITVGRFEKDSKNRLHVVNEHLKTGTYQPKPVKRVWIAKPLLCRTRALLPDGCPKF